MFLPPSLLQHLTHDSLPSSSPTEARMVYHAYFRLLFPHLCRLNASARIAAQLLPSSSASALCSLCRQPLRTRPHTDEQLFPLYHHLLAPSSSLSLKTLEAMQARLLHRAAGLVKGRPPGGGGGGRGLHTGRPPAPASLFTRVLQLFSPRISLPSAPARLPRPAAQRALHTTPSYPVRQFLATHARPSLPTPGRMPSLRVHNVGLGTARNYSTPAVRTIIQNAPMYIRAFVQADPELRRADGGKARSQLRRQKKKGRHHQYQREPMSAAWVQAQAQSSPASSVIADSELERDLAAYFPYAGSQTDGTCVTLSLRPCALPTPAQPSSAETSPSPFASPPPPHPGLDLPTHQTTHAHFTQHAQTVERVRERLAVLSPYVVGRPSLHGPDGSAWCESTVYRVGEGRVREVLGELLVGPGAEGVRVEGVDLRDVERGERGEEVRSASAAVPAVPEGGSGPTLADTSTSNSDLIMPSLDILSSPSPSPSPSSHPLPPLPPSSLASSHIHPYDASPLPPASSHPYQASQASLDLSASTAFSFTMLSVPEPEPEPDTDGYDGSSEGDDGTLSLSEFDIDIDTDSEPEPDQQPAPDLAPHNVPLPSSPEPMLVLSGVWLGALEEVL